MVSGHLQQKKGNWYIVLNLHDETGKRAPKWIATHLPVQGNKRRAEEMLLQVRQQYTDIYGKPGPSGPLFKPACIRSGLPENSGAEPFHTPLG